MQVQTPGDHDSSMQHDLMGGGALGTLGFPGDFPFALNPDKPAGGRTDDLQKIQA